MLHVQAVQVPLDLAVWEVLEVHAAKQEQQVLLVYKFRRFIDELPDKLDVQVNNRRPTVSII